MGFTMHTMPEAQTHAFCKKYFGEYDKEYRPTRRYRKYVRRLIISWLPAIMVSVVLLMLTEQPGLLHNVVQWLGIAVFFGIPVLFFLFDTVSTRTMPSVKIQLIYKLSQICCLLAEAPTVDREEYIKKKVLPIARFLRAKVNSGVEIFVPTWYVSDTTFPQTDDINNFFKSLEAYLVRLIRDLEKDSDVTLHQKHINDACKMLNVGDLYHTKQYFDGVVQKYQSIPKTKDQMKAFFKRSFEKLGTLSDPIQLSMPYILIVIMGFVLTALVQGGISILPTGLKENLTSIGPAEIVYLRYNFTTLWATLVMALLMLYQAVKPRSDETERACEVKKK